MLGISAGGVLVGVEVAEALGAPLDVIVVRRLGDAGTRFGAVAEGGIAIVHHDRAHVAGLAAHVVARLRAHAEDAADRAAQRLRAGAAPHDVVGRTVLLVQDELGAGDAELAAARTARRRGAARTVLATPIGGAGVVQRLCTEVDEVVCLERSGAGRAYAIDERPTEREVLAALERARAGGPLHVPEAARGAVVLIGGAPILLHALRDKALAVVTLPEDATREAVVAAVHRLRSLPVTAHLALGVVGFRRAAEAALGAAAVTDVRAVVTAGGRPDRVPACPAATLAIVGGEDRRVVALARAGGRETAVIPGAGHDLDEPGTLEQVAHLASAWLVHHLQAPPIPVPVRTVG